MSIVSSRTPVRHRLRKAGLVALGAAALVAGGLAAPAFAAPAATITVDPITVVTGADATVTVTGAGFAATTPFTAALDGTAQASAADTTDVDGALTSTVTVPAATAAGTHEISISDGTSTATADVYVTLDEAGGEAAQSPITVTAVTTTGQTVTLHGFLPGETVSGGYGTGGSGGGTGDTEVADATGTVSFTYVFESAGPGARFTLNGIGETSGVNAAVSFDVVADPTAPVTPAPAAPVATPVAGNASFTG